VTKLRIYPITQRFLITLKPYLSSTRYGRLSRSFSDIYSNKKEGPHNVAGLLYAITYELLPLLALASPARTILDCDLIVNFLIIEMIL
jgi:hypothetical protein